MKKLITRWASWRLGWLVLLALSAGGCSKSKDGIAGGPPKGDEIPSFYGIYAWDGTATSLPDKGQILWRGKGKALGGIIVFQQALASGMAPPEQMITLKKTVWLRNELEYVSQPGDHGQLLRMILRPYQKFQPVGKVSLKFMPLEKPGAVLAVPAEPLAPGVYALEFMDVTYAFSVDVGSMAEVQSVPGSTQDRVVISHAANTGGNWENWLSLPENQRQASFAGAQRTIRTRELTRDANISDEQAKTTRESALAAWEKKDYTTAVTQAVIALGYRSTDQELRRMVMEGPILAAKAKQQDGHLPAAEQWATYAFDAGWQRDDAAALLTDMTLTRLSDQVTRHLQQKEWDLAQRALNDVSYGMRSHPRITALRESIQKQETLAEVAGMISSSQYDEAARRVADAGTSGQLSADEIAAQMKTLRRKAHEDTRYYGGLFEPVWQVQIAEEDLHVDRILKVRGSDKIVAVITTYGEGKTLYVTLKASTGEVLSRVSSNHQPALLSENGRFVLYKAQPPGGGYSAPTMAYILDLESKRTVDALTSPWPDSNSSNIPFAISGTAGLFARAPAGHDFVVEVFKAASGTLVRRITLPGIRRAEPSQWTLEQPFVPVLAFSPKGDKLVTVDADEVARVFDTASGVQIGEGVKVDDAQEGTILVNEDASRILAHRPGILGGTSYLHELKPSAQRQSLATLTAIHNEWSVGIEAPGMSFFGQPSLTFTSIGSDRNGENMDVPFNPTAGAFDDALHAVYVGGKRGALARLAVLADTPATGTVVTPAPSTTAASPANAAVEALPEKLAAFILAHHKNEETRKVDVVIGSYAPLVDYFESGNVGLEHIRKDKEAYFSKWTRVRTTVKHQPRAVDKGQGRYFLAYPVNFEVESPTGEIIEGDVECEVEIMVNAEGRPQIVREKGRVTRREKR
ncbi:MAG: hypothetical protein ACAH88_19505 [Roseimicrobium sp.]